MLNGETLSEAHEVQLAQEEYDAVKQENDLLKVLPLLLVSPRPRDPGPPLPLTQ